MNVAGLQTTEKFLVMDGLNPDVIVGLRYLLERGCRLDWEHCCLWLEGGIRKAPMTVAGPQIPCDPDPVLTLCAEINGDTPGVCYIIDELDLDSPCRSNSLKNTMTPIDRETTTSLPQPTETFEGGFLTGTGFQKRPEVPWGDVRDGKVQFRRRNPKRLFTRRRASVSSDKEESPKSSTSKSSRSQSATSTFFLASEKPSVAESTDLNEDIETILDLAAPNVDGEARKQLQLLVSEFRDVFALTDEELGLTKLTVHKIDTGDSPPIKRPPHRMAPGKLPEMKAEVETMLARGIIRPSKSPYSSPIVMVKKKDGSNRFCVDYRKLNDITRKDAFPIPRIEQTLDALAGACCFSTLDLASGYWQVPVDPVDIPKTAFVTADGGLYEYTRMPFGLCNAPATFQRLMNDLYKDVLYKSVIVFLDDVLTFSRSIEEHMSHLRCTFQRLREANLKLKPKKCCLLQREVAYPGHIVDKEGSRPNPEKLAALESWPTPTTVTGVRSFIGFCSYYRKYIRGFAEIARPLHALTKKSVKFTWKPEHTEAFDQLRNELVRGPVLSFPDFSQPFIIDTDASNNSLGAVLSNVIDGEERPLAFMSRVLSKTETMYSTTKREALAVVQALSWFRSYILGLKIVIRTDHASLRWMFRQNADGMTFRMVQKLQEYDYTIVHRPGNKHGNADGLTRREDPREDWKDGELEALRGQCPEPKPCEEALEDVRDFLKTMSELRPSAHLNAAASDQPEESCRTLMTSNRYPDPVMEIEDFLLDSCRSLVQCITVDFRLVTLYQDEPNFDPFLAEALPTLKRQPMPGDVIAIRDTEKPRWRYYLIIKKFAWEKTNFEILNTCLQQLRQLLESHGVHEVSIQRLGSGNPDCLNWWQVRRLVSDVFGGTQIHVWVHYGAQGPPVQMEQCRAHTESPMVQEPTTLPELSEEEGRSSAENGDGEIISWVRAPCDVKKAQREDPHIGVLLEMLKYDNDDVDVFSLGEPPLNKEDAVSLGDEVTVLWSQWPQLTIRKGVLYRRWKCKAENSEVFQLVVPSSHQKDILDQLHSSPVSGGHFAVEKTLSRIRQRFWWPKMRQHIEKKVELCLPCAARRTAGKQRVAELMPMQIGTRFNTVAADILGPVTKGVKTKSKYVLAMTDLFTKFVVAVPLKDITAQCVASELVEHWVLRFGVPDVLHTDQGSNFNSELMKQVRQLLQIDKSQTTAYHPQGNGQVERFNRVIADTISKYCAENPRTWDLVLPYVTFVYNTTVHKTTRATPFSLVYGEECQYPIDLFYPKPIDHEYTEAGDFATWLHETFREAHAHARLMLGCAQRRRKDLYHKKVHGKPYQPGARVWLFSPHKAKSRKFFLPWEGPFVVGERINEVNYKIWKESKPSKWFIVHYNRLKPYRTEQTETRVLTRPRPEADEVPFDYTAWGDEMAELDAPALAETQPAKVTSQNETFTSTPLKNANAVGAELALDIPLQDGRTSTFTPTTPIPPTFLPSPWLNVPAWATPRNDQPIENHNDEASPSLFPQGLPPSEDPITERHFEVGPSRDTGEGDRQQETSWTQRTITDESAPEKTGDATGAREHSPERRRLRGKSNQPDENNGRPKRLRFPPVRYGLDEYE